jgi:glycosyltransferase involved in cell wall biosynthesis
MSDNDPSRPKLPSVSVVVIFRDAQRFLGEAIDSVFAQTYREWELLLVDDGSSDGSTAIAKEVALRASPRVKYLEHAGHRNRGMSASRNLGIAQASGEWVALLDADDVWMENKLEEQVAVFAQEPDAALVYGTRELWTDWESSDRGATKAIVPHGIPVDRLFRSPELFLLTFGRRQATVPCSSDLMFRRGAALGVGGFEESFSGMYEDQAFLVKLELVSTVFVSSRCWTRYRQHADSCVARWAAGKVEEQAWDAFLAWMGEYVARAEPKPSASVRRAVRRVLRNHRHPRMARLLGLPASLSRRAIASGGTVC